MIKMVSKILMIQLLLAILFLSNTTASYAYDTLYVGGLDPVSKTDTINISYMFPFGNSLFGQSRVLYLPEELFGKKVEIFSYAFYILHRTGPAMDTFEIFMRNYDGVTFVNDTLDTSYTNGFHKVYQHYGFRPYSYETGLYTFKFEKPFIYDGASSLEVVVLHKESDRGLTYTVATYPTTDIRFSSCFFHSSEYIFPTSYTSKNTYAVRARFEYNIIDEDTSSISELNAANIEVAPNPVSSKLNIKYQSSVSSESTISILDMTGAVVYSFDRVNTLGINELSLDVNKLNLMSGTYFVRINSKGTNLIKSFIVSK